MKTKKIMMIFAIAASLTAMACDMYNDAPSKKVRKEFKTMYPEARDIDWDREGIGWSVSFDIGYVEYEALYDWTGKWLMTETDVPLSKVPAEIKGYLGDSKEFGSLPFDDDTVEYYKTPSGNFYRFELLKDRREIEVDVYENGTVSLSKRGIF